MSFPRRRARLRSVAAFSGLLALPAAAAFAHVGGPGTGLRPTTSRPDLQSVTLDAANDVNDNKSEQAVFCFDEALTGIAPPSGALPDGGKAGFWLQTYDSGRILQSESADLVPNQDNKCVVARFRAVGAGGGGDLAQSTVGSVAEGAVLATQESNPVASEPVSGSALSKGPGRTSAPDLVSGAIEEATNNTITYGFDETIDPAVIPTDPGAIATAAARFGFIRSNGDVVTGQDFNASFGGGFSGDKKALTVRFGVPVSDAKYFFVRTDAVRDTPSTGGGTTGSAVDGVGSGIVRPVISGASRVAGQPTVFDVTFDRPIASPNSSLFKAIADDGTIYSGTGTPNVNGTTVRVTFENTFQKEPQAIVRVAVEQGAVQSVSGQASDAGAPSDWPVDTANDNPGYTNGPDLLRTTIDPVNHQATFYYDEPINDTPVPTAINFRVLNEAGNDTQGNPGTTSVTGSTATVGFAGALEVAAGTGMFYGAVNDMLGNPSPRGSVSTKNEEVEAPAAPPAPPQPPAPPAQPPTVTISKVKTKITLRRKGGRLVGRVTAGSGCNAGRTVVLRRAGKGKRSYGRAKSSSRGSFSIKRHRRARGKRVYVIVTGRTTATTQCLTARSRGTRG